MQKKFLSVLIPSVLAIAPFATTAGVYFPEPVDNVETVDDAKQWLATHYAALTGEVMPALTFDKTTHSAHAVQYRFHQAFADAKTCRSSVVVNVDRHDHTVNQLYRYLKTAAECAGVKRDQRQFLLRDPLAHHDPEQQKAVTVAMKVFDPDPVTALGDNTLRYETAMPQQAYHTAQGVTVTEVNGQRYLANSRVKMVDVIGFDQDGDGIIEPDHSRQAISHSQHDFIRDRQLSDYAQGNAQFLETMAFYHVDQSLQYLESLGFALFDQPVQVDAFYGNKDNSTTYGAQNVIVLGNGMSADAEDAGVILHELAHMINYRLIDNWEEGDTGAIGEGLGDYWAASYNLRQFPDSEVDTVFRWDGINTATRSTRSVNDQHAMYHSGLDYPAHVTRNGTQADQLWSTPLFSSLKHAVAERGQPAHKEIDTLIWEGIAALGAGATLPQAASSIVNAAKRLHPNDDFYADTFAQAFRHHHILTPPIRYYAPQFLTPKQGRQQITVMAHNMLSHPIDDASVMLAQGGDQVTPIHHLDGAMPLTVEVDLSFAPSCGQPYSLSLMTRIAPQQGQREDTMMSVLPMVMCQPVLSQPVTPMHSMLVDAVGINQWGSVEKGEKMFPLALNSDESLSSDFAISIKLRHKRMSDLSISLIPPSGDVEIPLFMHEAYQPADFEHVYMSTFDPRLRPLIGMPMKGLWQLKIIDRVPEQQGELLAWGIANVTGYQALSDSSPDAIDKAPVEHQTSGKSGGFVNSFTSLLLLAFVVARHLRRTKKE